MLEPRFENSFDGELKDSSRSLIKPLPIFANTVTMQNENSANTKMLSLEGKTKTQQNPEDIVKKILRAFSKRQETM